MNYRDRAVQTLDILLWESLARICGTAFSKSFHTQGVKVRVVYETFLDPRKLFDPILWEVESLIQDNMEIGMMKGKLWKLSKIRHWCTRPEYYVHFLERIKAVEADIYVDRTAEIDFVLLGPYFTPAIVCPSTAEYLLLTKNLRLFDFKIQPPKKVGRNKYEFRFEIT